MPCIIVSSTQDEDTGACAEPERQSALVESDTNSNSATLKAGCAIPAALSNRFVRKQTKGKNLRLTTVLRLLPSVYMPLYFMEA